VAKFRWCDACVVAVRTARAYARAPRGAQWCDGGRACKKRARFMVRGSTLLPRPSNSLFQIPRGLQLGTWRFRRGSHARHFNGDALEQHWTDWGASRRRGSAAAASREYIRHSGWRLRSCLARAMPNMGTASEFLAAGKSELLWGTDGGVRRGAQCRGIEEQELTPQVAAEGNLKSMGSCLERESSALND